MKEISKASIFNNVVILVFVTENDIIAVIKSDVWVSSVATFRQLLKHHISCNGLLKNGPANGHETPLPEKT